MGSLERLAFALILFATFFVSIYYRARARKNSETIPRAAEGKTFLFVRIASGLLLMILFLATAAAPRWLAWSMFAVAASIRYAGMVLGVMVIVLIRQVFLAIGSNISETFLTKTDHVLVAQGPYRYLRHPLYALALIQLAALGLISGSWLIGLLTVLAAILMRLVIIPREEAMLVEKFGDAYRDYQTATGALLPRLRGAAEGKGAKGG